MEECMKRRNQTLKKKWIVIISILLSLLFGMTLNASALEPYNSLDLGNAAEALELFGIDDVRHNITMPEKGEYDTTITWKSSRPDIITDKVINGKAPGVVTRPAGGKIVVVTLTATLTDSQGETIDKEFLANVTPIDPELDTDYSAGYLWTYFNSTNLQPSGSTGTTNSLHKIFYGFSEDGLHWNTINKKNGVQYPVAESVVGYTGVRDPHVIRSHEGDKYWILGTDLQNGFDQENGSKSVIVWESYDLINWTESRLEMVFSYAGNVWAPEAIYDEESGDYLVYWASRDQRDGATSSVDSALRIYVSRTRDFHTFTEPVIWADEHDNTSSEKNIIDSSIAYVNGLYYRFSTSDWYTVVDYCETLSTDINDWKRIMARGTHGSFGLEDVEGLTSYQLPDGRWCIMGDDNAYRGYVIEEEDFHTQMWTKLATSGTNSKSNTFDKNFRHGTVMRLSATEEEALMEAYGQESDYAPSPRYSVYVKNGTSDPFVTTEGETVTITYNKPATGNFLYWSARGITLTEQEKTSTSLTFTMPANDVRLIAVLDVAVTDIVVSPKTLNLKTGDKATLTAALKPTDAVQNVTWSSDNESVAKVDENGNVTAIKAGTAKITVASSENPAIKTDCIITVEEVTPPQPQPEPEPLPTLKKISKITAKSASCNSIELNWNKVDKADGYEIYRATSKNGTYQLVKTIQNGSTLKEKDKKLKFNKKYYYKVRAYKKVNGVIAVTAEFSNAVSAKTKVGTPKVTLKKLSSTSMRIKWQKVTGASGYQVKYSLKKKSGYNTATIKKAKIRTYTQTGLKKGKTYYVKVRAYRKVKGKNIYGSWAKLNSIKLR